MQQIRVVEEQEFGYQSLGEAIYNKASAKRGPRVGQIGLELIDTA